MYSGYLSLKGGGKDLKSCAGAVALSYVDSPAMCLDDLVSIASPNPVHSIAVEYPLSNTSFRSSPGIPGPSSTTWDPVLSSSSLTGKENRAGSQLLGTPTVSLLSVGVRSPG